MSRKGTTHLSNKTQAGTPPCELGCEHVIECFELQKACRQYVRYQAHGDIKENLPRKPRKDLY